ncbi:MULTISPECIES: polysaccharide pyruvyl transferase family protein [Blautia]|uniref:polysaccharide pyruvyl transferase family protein n=1 Tax=Blautia TaxID=572511 RepID=UPI00138FD65C|nr:MULTISPECIES: polysaccharide pyruvyl transferase family protein [Blautia]
MQEKYDVAILGVWYGCNYGSVATYYSLYSVVTNLGKSVLMVHRPWITAYDEKGMERRESLKFARMHYNVSESYNIKEIYKLNEICDTFLLGSDQLWNYGITKIFGHSYFLDFVTKEKKKIAYATSFGSSRFLAPWNYAWKALICMRNMNYVSVREEMNVKMCSKLFGINAAHTLDPVLLCDSSCLGALADESKRKIKTNYIAAYILDPTPQKKDALLYLADKMGKELVIMLDGWPHLFKGNQEKMGLQEFVVSDLNEYDWVFYLKNSDFIVTDSFHGTCMAVLFEKQFISFANPGRGSDRFESLMKTFDLFDRYFRNPNKVKEFDDTNKIDYQAINQVLNREREASMKWLEEALCNGTAEQSVINENEHLYPLRLVKSILLYYRARIKNKYKGRKK